MRLQSRQLPSIRARRRWLTTLLLLAGVIGACSYLEIDPFLLFTDFHFITGLFREMLPPDMHILFSRKSIVAGIGQTLAMALLGTLAGSSIAFLLAFPAAGSVTQNRHLNNLIKLVLTALRVIPGFVYMLVFLVLAGLGPVAGTCALIFSSTGTGGRLFTESLEKINVPAYQAVKVSGCTKLQAVYFGVWPQVKPSFFGHTFYLFDHNLRAAVALGVFGAGGIGFELHKALRLLRYREAFAILIIIVVLILVLERASSWGRSKFLYA